MAEMVPTIRTFAPPAHDRPVEFATYGEATSVPVHVRAARVSVAAPALTCRAARHFLCTAEMTVEQDAVQNGAKGVAGKLRFPLPLEASVSRFEFQRACPERGGELSWYPAVPLAKQKAKEVAEDIAKQAMWESGHAVEDAELAVEEAEAEAEAETDAEVTQLCLHGCGQPTYHPNSQTCNRDGTCSEM